MSNNSEHETVARDETYMVARDQYHSAIHNISYHRPQHQSTQQDMELIREGAKHFLTDINAATSLYDCPRERAMAYRAVEDAVMYAIAGIARHEGDGR